MDKYHGYMSQIRVIYMYYGYAYVMVCEMNVSLICVMDMGDLSSPV